MLYFIYRVGVPVIIIGETGCGKTKLIDFVSKLQIPTALKDEVNTMITASISAFCRPSIPNPQTNFELLYLSGNFITLLQLVVHS